ncbi:MAG: hypothetical protein Q7R79_01725, partial [bacterium]|nr:hypothetical protein [bacterium]
GQVLSTDGSGALSWATASGSPNVSFFGDGTDGAYTLANQGTAPSGITKTSDINNATVFRLDRDIYCTTLTVNSTVTLVTNGYRIFSKTSVTNSGTIHSNGNNGFGTTAGGATTQSVVNGGYGGGAGAATVGNPGASSIKSLGRTGGTGGTGTSGNTGGGGGACAAPGVANGSLRNPLSALNMFLVNTSAAPVRIDGGCGGGGGGGDSSLLGAGGGGGGGIVVIAAPIITNTSATISANGGNGESLGGSVGGGGGGGGGIVALIYNTLNAGTETASGGAAGTCGSCTLAATAGSAGTVIKIAQ